MMQPRINLAVATLFASALALAPSSSHAVVPVLLARELVKQVLEDAVQQRIATTLAGTGCNGAPDAASSATGAAGSANAVAATPNSAPGALASGAVQHTTGMFAKLAHLGQLAAALGGNRGSLASAALPELAGAASARAGTSVAADANSVAGNVAGAVTGAVAAEGTSNAVTAAPEASSGTTDTSPSFSTVTSKLQDAVSHPLTPGETMQAFGELHAFGLLDQSGLDGVQQCLNAGGFLAERTLGTTAAALEVTVLPPLRQAKAQFGSLTPEEQSAVAHVITDQLESMSVAKQQKFLDGVGAGLFPAPVIAQVRSSLGQP